MLGQDDEHVTGVDAVARLVGGEHAFVQLLARPNADDLAGHARRHRLGEVDHSHRRQLWDVGLAAGHVLECVQHEIDRLRQRDPKAGHALVGDRQTTRRLDLLLEHRHDGSAGTDHVAVSHTGEAGLGLCGVRVALHEDLLGAQLRCAVEVGRVHRLVGRECDDSRHLGVDGGIDHVLRAEHVGAHRFERVVLARGHLLHRGSVHDDVAALRGACHTRTVTDVADEVPNLAVAELGPNLGLLQFVSGVDPHDGVGPLVDDSADERIAETAGATGEENRLA